MSDRKPAEARVVSNSTLVVDDELRPYQVVELIDEDDQLIARYSRYLNIEETAWVRHGVWQSFAPNGQVVSRGNYTRGQEHGPWQDFHDNGQLAAEGRYDIGKEVGCWKYWDRNGQLESQEEK